ncbi:MAG: FtsX-like permease family protein [Actinobacteria bacterium]|nr:FtsX-like permease family protein [Actinomycetota bacterium]MDA2995299.1 FtsX-like permease family protein [Actinomycetota bacterium]
MIKLALRGARANLGRLILTLISVVLGVAFVSGSFVLADSLRSIFNQVSEDAFAGVDAQVRGASNDMNSTNGETPRFNDDVISAIANLPEAEYTEGGLFSFERAYTIDANNEVVRPTGPPVFTGSWSGPSPVSSFRMIEGEPPTGQQVVIDPVQAERGGFVVGQEITVSLPTGEPEVFTLSGTIDFGEGGTGGAFFILFDLPTTQRVLGLPGQIDSVVVSAATGVSPDELVTAISAVLPDNLEAVTGEVVIGEQKEDFGTFINIFGNVLLGFAVVVLFVSTFIINNTFATLVGQRTRMFGLMRSIGASGKQIMQMVFIEAGSIGIAASGLGLVGGLGVASALKRLFSSAGGEFPDGPLEIRTRTIVVVIIVGMGVTLASAILPALRASRVTPLEAFRTGGRASRPLTVRIALGSAVLLLGLVFMAIGMFGNPGGTSATLALIGVGGALTFIGVSMLSAMFAGAVAGFIGTPVAALRGVTGRIARGNASRNPQRTSSTVTALMIGLALISGVAVLTRSILDSFEEVLNESISADLWIFETNQGLEFSGLLVEQLAELPEVDQVAGFSPTAIRIGDEVLTATGFDSTTGTSVVNMGIIDGTAEVGRNGIAILDSVAEERQLAVGDQLSVEFEDGFVTTLNVRGIFDDAAIAGADWLIDRDLSREHRITDAITFAGLTYAEGVDPAVGRAVVEATTAAFPQLSVQDNTEFQEEAEGQIAQLQVVITALLVLCLVVAFFGIVNTMVLAVLERTREIGLLRAVGMTRRQLQSSVRWEAAIISLFGALLGVALGLLLGWAAVIAIPDSFVSKLGIPWGQLVVYIIVGGLLGVVAAWFPARRAARLDVLEAISTQ